jgi:hypothetical protein
MRKPCAHEHTARCASGARPLTTAHATLLKEERSGETGAANPARRIDEKAIPIDKTNNCGYNLTPRQRPPNCGLSPRSAANMREMGALRLDHRQVLGVNKEGSDK